jgi:hypothetical protein
MASGRARISQSSRGWEQCGLEPAGRCRAQAREGVDAMPGVHAGEKDGVDGARKRACDRGERLSA